MEALLREFLASDEYRQKLQFLIDQNGGPGSDAQFAPRPVEPTTIDVQVNDDDLSYLFNRTREQWTKLGADEPFWSVLTFPRYKSANMDAGDRDAFFQSGADLAKLVEIFEQRNADRLPRTICLELGCGVGRVTRHLATRFERVIAVDISATHLQQCQNTMSEAGIANVDCLLLRSPSDVAFLPEFDFFFSTIALQHNTPPVQRFILDQVFSRLRPGGGVLFQAVAWLPHYSFDMQTYRTQGSGEMDMHCLPMRAIFDIARRRGVSLREIVMDGQTRLYGSYTYFGVK